MNQQHAQFVSPLFLRGLLIGLVVGMGIGVPLRLVLSSGFSRAGQHSFGLFPLVRTERGLITLVPSHPILSADLKEPRPTESVSSQREPALTR